MKKRKFADGGIYTAEMGQPPMEPDGGSVRPKPAMKKPVPKKPAPKDKKRYTGTVEDSSGTYDSYRDAKNKEVLIAPATGKEKGAAGAGRGFVNRQTFGEMATLNERERMQSEAATAYGYKKGGSVSSRGDGIAQRGKTRA